MPFYTTTCGNRIFYHDLNSGSNKTIVFIHGNSQASGLWMKQITDPLFSNFRLIVPDLPGHGNSDPLPDNEYSVIKFGKQVAELIEHLNLQRILLTGFSMGGNVIGEMLPILLNRPFGICLIGASLIGGKFPIGSIFKPEFDSAFLFMEEYDKNKIRFSIQTMYSDDLSLEERVNEFATVKQGVRSGLMNSVHRNMYSDEIANLNECGICIAAIQGGKEQVLTNYIEKALTNLWNKKVHYIENAGHFAMTEQPAVVNRILFDYATEKFTDTHL